MIETINKQHETISKQQANREKRLILRHLKGASDPFVLFCFKCWQRPQHDQSDGAVFNVNKSQNKGLFKVIHVSQSFLFIEPQSQIALKSCLWSSIKKTAFFLPDRSACNYNEDFADIN